MADHEIRRRANIGSSSLILIFIVLCLATFAVLTLGNAKREETFSEKRAESVQEYYRADAEGEAFVREIDQAIQISMEFVEPSKRKARMIDAAGPDYHAEKDCFTKDIPMKYGLALHVEVAVDWEQGTCYVQEWKVCDTAEFEIDQSMPVWSGM